MKQTYGKKKLLKAAFKICLCNGLFSHKISFLKLVLNVTICFPTAIVLTGKMELAMLNIIKLSLKSSSFFPGNSGVVVILLCFLSGWHHRALLQDRVCDAKSQKDLWQTHWELECQVIFISISLQLIYLLVRFWTPSLCLWLPYGNRTSEGCVLDQGSSNLFVCFCF